VNPNKMHKKTERIYGRTYCKGEQESGRSVNVNCQDEGQKDNGN
jgi:hypothetical protein